VFLKGKTIYVKKCIRGATSEVYEVKETRRDEALLWRVNEIKKK